ncbi:type III secretion system export apparatus subunit SctS [Agarilytica rhodophyticola]|uniref:type III secretion system export apparatus subunit SctS n=1 Tax=Agarilytica rhodophyticola TaxID=1737490 RepID=UPI000B348AF4|nr:type III secretion system export apparatus subunit SctS [Agarilytica rhodophyticola]
MHADTLNIVKQALMLVVQLSMPPLMAALTFGILISLVQTLFQVQDQTLPFAVKLIAVSLVLAMTGAWIGGEVLNLLGMVFGLLPDIGN